MHRVGRPAPHRAALCTALRNWNWRSWPDRGRVRAEMDRYRAHAGRAEGTSKASALRIPPQIAAKPNPGAKIRKDDVCPQERTGRGRRLRKSKPAASLAVGRGLS